MNAVDESGRSSIEASEIAYYEQLANLWWDPHGPFWPLQRLNHLRSDFLRGRLASHFQRRPTASDPLAGLRLLDIGCGGGLLSEAMASLGAQVCGVDVVARNIEVARLHAASKDLNIDYEFTTAENLAASGRTYDAVLNMEVVEHVADLPLFLDACCALVRPGGIMVIATIDRTVWSWLGAIVLAEHVLRWLPRGTHRWRKFPRPGELSAHLARHGFEVEAPVGVRINPFSRNFRLSRFTAINYMLTASKPE
jgi:2-polyprenyl-6-hydroxyphenyl methylase/3-demethylubiquinone-9 3-methyltransferase